MILNDPNKREEVRPSPAGGLQVALKLAAWGTLAALALYRLTNTVADYDLWNYLSFGRLFWTSGGVPYRDVFAYTPTLNLWVYHEWLSGALYYALYQVLGGSGLQLFKYATGLGALALVYLTARRRGGYPAVAGVVLAILATWLTLFYSPVRAHVSSILFFALFLMILEEARLSGNFKRLYALPLLMALWCNLHGGFLAGLGLIFLYALGELLARRPWRPYVAALLLGSLVTLVNPYGLNYWDLLGRVVTSAYPHTTEWASLFTTYQRGHSPGLEIFNLGLLLLVALYAMWQSRWRELTPSLALAVTLVLGLRQQRHLVFFLLLLAAYLPVCLNIYLDFLRNSQGLQRFWQRKSVQIALLATLSSVTLAFIYATLRQNPLSLEIPAQPPIINRWTRPAANCIYYPVGAVKFIKEHRLVGNIAPVFHWGLYVSWELYPQCRVAIDGRDNTVYPREVMESYAAFHYALPGWRQFLEHYPTDLILLDSKSPLAPLLRQEPGWQVAYADPGSVLFRRARSNPGGP